MQRNQDIKVNKLQPLPMGISWRLTEQQVAGGRYRQQNPSFSSAAYKVLNIEELNISVLHQFVIYKKEKIVMLVTVRS